MPTVIDGKTVDAGYKLLPLETTMWAHIHESGLGKAFQSLIDFEGERCGTLSCPKQFGGVFEGNEGTSPGEPWAQEGGNGVKPVGDQFFDPAYTMSQRLSFLAPFSLDYCWNPFVGITSGCGDEPDAGLDASSDSGLLDAPLVDGSEAATDASSGLDASLDGDMALPDSDALDAMHDATSADVTADSSHADAVSGSDSSGCGCEVTGQNSRKGWWILLFGFVLRRRPLPFRRREGRRMTFTGAGSRMRFLR
jgi:hypothetical protein